VTVVPPARLSAVRKLSVPDLLFAGLMLLFVLLSWSASRQESVTIDEFRHLSTGVHYWQSGDFSFDAATPPLWKMVMALPAWLAGAEEVQFRQLPELAAGWEPWFVATDFMRDNGAAYSGYLQSARMVNILAAVLCLIMLYLRCRRIFGGAAALFGSAFLAFSPTFLAHSHYATTDIIATLTMLVTVFLLMDYLRSPGLPRLITVSFAFSLALLCKYSALLLAPLLFTVALVPYLKRPGGDGGFRRQLPALSLVLAIVVITPLLTVNSFYGFRGTGTPLGMMHLESRALASLAQGAAGALPLPLPRAFVEGFDKQKADSDYAEFPAYFMDKWSLDGFRSYYAAAFCLKESLPFLLLLAVALPALFRHKRAALSRGERLLLLYLPVALFFILSFMNKLNVGVRYLLPVYPYFCLFIAGLYHDWSNRRGARLALIFLFVLHSLSVLRVSPHYTAYFNEFAGGPANGYRYLIDSNIDWGQDLLHLQRYMQEQGINTIQLAYFGHGLPESYGVNYVPLSLPARPGYVAISVSLLQGHPYLLTYTDPPQIAEAERFRSLRGLQPVGRAGYSILIYRID